MAGQSKIQQNQPEKRKTIEELIHDFCQDLQKGDFGLNKIIKNGYLLYGQTRSGKTAASHLFSGNALKGVKIGGEEKVENTTSKYKNAKIGNTPVSQTRVPNLFPVNHPNDPSEKAYVIDTPGYGDTYGTYRLLGNGYYHYKLYSKVQNMKFILCFDTIQLQNTAQLFIDTIVQFTSYFKDYEDHKEQIWKSCVFLINKVDENVFSLEDLKTKMMEIQKSIKIQKKPQQIDLIKQFISNIVKNDKVFIIKKYRLGDSATRADLLKTIDLKLQWWSRKIVPKHECTEKEEDLKNSKVISDAKEQNKSKVNGKVQSNAKVNDKIQINQAAKQGEEDYTNCEVDMSPILFNISKPILVELTRNELSKEEFIKLVEYYNDRINEILQPFNQFKTQSCSLDFVFNELVKDAMSKDFNSHKFLKPMEKYIDKYYKIYDPNYKEQREKFQKELFQLKKQSKSTNQSNSAKGNKLKDKNFIVKKFKMLQKVEKLKSDMNSYENESTKQHEKSQVSKNQQRKLAVQDMIREFNNVSYKRKNSIEIIYKYGYIIHRVISEVQVLLLLMGSGSTDKSEKCVPNNRIIEAAEGKYLSLKLLPAFMGLSYMYQGEEYTYEELKSKFVKDIDLKSQEFSSLTINWDLADLFSSVQVGHEDSDIIMQKIVVMYEKFSEQFLREKQTDHKSVEDTFKLIGKLVTARINCFELVELSADQDRKNYFFFITKRITNNIGLLLESQKKYSLAREAYKSMMAVHSVCRLYQEQINDQKKLKIATSQQSKDNNKDKKELQSRLESGLELWIEYGDYLKNHGRSQQAIAVLQQAFELASNKQELEKVKSKLNDVLLSGGDVSDYQSSLFQATLLKPFSEKFVHELQRLSIKIYQTEQAEAPLNN